MKKLYFLDEEEKNRILNLHETATKNHYLTEQNNFFNDQLNTQRKQNQVVVQGQGNDPYQYMKWSDKLWYAKKSEGNTPKWKEAKTRKAIDAIKTKIYGIQPTNNSTTSNIQKTQSGKNFDFNDPLKLKQLNQKNAFNYKEIIDKIKTKNTEIKPGVTSWLRKRFPNIAELLKGRRLTPEDLTTDQKKALVQVIENSQKSNPKQKNSGNTTYSDYGSDVYNEFVKNHGSPTMWDTIWETVTNNDLFAMATLFGRFHWVKNSDGSYTIDDKYDFAPPAYENVTGVNRKSLEGKSITEISVEYMLNPYEAARVKGWVDHPESIPEKSIPLKITINPSQLV